MKYVIIVCDSLSDKPIVQLDDHTPLSAADTPTINKLVKNSEIGITKLSDSVLKPESIKGNMSIMGYFPTESFGGVSVFEAVASGIDLGKDDVVFYCNLVSLSEEEKYDNCILNTEKVNDLTSEELDSITELLNNKIGNEIFHFYRTDNGHILMVWKNGEPDPGILFSPLSAKGRPVKEHSPKGDFTPVLYNMMKQSVDILKTHPINSVRKEQGKLPVNSIWLWCNGIKPDLKKFKEKYGLDVSLVSSDKAVVGLGKLVGMNVFYTLDVKNTVMGLIKSDCSMVYIHTPVLSGKSLEGDFEEKKKCIEQIDREIVLPVISALEDTTEDYTIMIVSSVTTSCEQKKNIGEPVPYLIYKSSKSNENNTNLFDEQSAFDSGIYVPYGSSLIDKMIN